MRVRLAQLDPSGGDISANVERARAVLADGDDVALAVFPELFVCGYRPAVAESVAIEAGDAPLDGLAEACRESRTAAVIGFAERTERGSVANSVACIGADGRLAGVYRKTHLFGRAELDAFEAGASLLIADLAGVRVAPLICFDIEFPEPARAVTMAGADVLVTASANMDPYRDDHDLLSRARALENRVPHVYVNRVGSESGYRFVGDSRVIDREGRVVAEAAGDEPRVLDVDLELSGDRTDPAVDYLSQARDALPVLTSESTSLGGA